MKEIKEIATYLLAKGLTAGQTLGKWLSQLATGWANDPQFLPSGRFNEYVRNLHERNIINQVVATHLLQFTLWQHEAAEMIRVLHSQQISVIFEHEQTYPEAFRHIPDKPAVLYVWGNKELLNNQKYVTLVGTREPSAWASMKAKQCAFESVYCGLVVVSGKAQGIDSLVLTETLERKGSSIAVVPQLSYGDIDRYKKFKKNVVFVSEYPPMTSGISKWQYVARNRLLAAMSPYTVVIEAPIKSGTLITADLACEYGKSVYVMLSDPAQESAYGGIVFAQTLGQGNYIQSMYDVFYAEGDHALLQKYCSLVALLSKNKIVLEKTDARHLAATNLRRYIYAACNENLALFDKCMIELHRFGIIRERKQKIVFNFSGYESWQKI